MNVIYVYICLVLGLAALLVGIYFLMHDTVRTRGYIACGAGASVLLVSGLYFHYNKPSFGPGPAAVISPK